MIEEAALVDGLFERALFAARLVRAEVRFEPRSGPFEPALRAREGLRGGYARLLRSAEVLLGSSEPPLEAPLPFA